MRGESERRENERRTRAHAIRATGTRINRRVKAERCGGLRRHRAGTWTHSAHIVSLFGKTVLATVAQCRLQTLFALTRKRSLASAQRD